ncbi:hypothetical protein KFZ70_10420 [Tamlana fucoidanivorans]|uniref:PliI/PliC-like inhibitor of I-type lysozyme n=1 Tax=Allotamlana fucoidanivorans TaxID=2583814 RepID=A0A5C4SQ96_9FLAO|nr:hypothetical protein [Tamlana fucoidanivorans]TNJ45724.1 hypothetical protein FGF67_04905 [Tamlana fucoidanivorans]
MKNITLTYILSICFLLACKQTKENHTTNVPLTTEHATPTASLSIIGNYVDTGYTKRDQGYDWVSVSVKEDTKNTILISIRSRADKKKPTCTFDAKAYKKTDTTYESMYDGKNIIYTFTDNTILISTEKKEDENSLYFFCSGGATIAGTYSKINNNLDQNQIDKTAFTKHLSLQGIGFNVSSIMQNNTNTLHVYAFGLEVSPFDETFNIDGFNVIDVEVEDLDADGSPELLVYLKNETQNNQGKVFGFSVNNKKSMSMVYFPPTAEQTKINEGYRGHDEFTLIETNLAQRFPVYKPDDSDAAPSGGIRQITYKLKKGEAMKKFEIDQISRY